MLAGPEPLFSTTTVYVMGLFGPTLLSGDGVASLVITRLGTGMVLLMTCVISPLVCRAAISVAVTLAWLLMTVPLTTPFTWTVTVTRAVSLALRPKPLTSMGFGPVTEPWVVLLVTRVTNVSSVSEMTTLLNGSPLLATVIV